MRFLLLTLSIFVSGNWCLACGPYEEECEVGGLQIERYSSYDSLDCSIDVPFLEVSNRPRENMHLLTDTYLPKVAVTPRPSDEDPREWAELKSLIDVIFANNMPELDEILQNRQFGHSIYNSDVGVSNNLSQVIKFIKASKSEGLPSQQMRKIVRDRLKTLVDTYHSCQEGDPDLPPSDAFEYEQGTRALYCLKYTDAINHFCKLKTSSDPWFKQNGLYSCGRAQLLASQANWDGETSPEQVIDKPLSQQAIATFREYIEAYPNDEYIKSASGLTRRAYLFNADWRNYVELLDNSLGEAVALNDVEAVERLGIEFSRRETRVFESGSLPKHPFLITMLILAEYRNSLMNQLANSEASSKTKSLLIDYLTSNEQNIKKYPGLFEMLSSLLGIYPDNVSITENYPLRTEISQLFFQSKAFEQNKNWPASVNALSHVIQKLESIGIPPVNYADNSYRPNIDAKDVLKRALLRTALREGDIGKISEGELKDVSEKDFISMIEILLPENDLYQIMKNPKAKKVYRNSARRTLATIELYKENFIEVNRLLKNADTSVKFPFTNLMPYLKDLSGSQSAKSLAAFADYLKDRVTNVSLTPSQYITETWSNISSRPMVPLDAKRSSLKLYYDAVKAARREGDRKTEAYCIASLLNCYREEFYNPKCSYTNYDHSDIVISDSEKAEMFYRLKTKLKNTPSAKDQKYWYGRSY